MCSACASQSQLRDRCGLEEADGEKVLRRSFLYPASHDNLKITTNCFRAGARMLNRLSSRAGGRCVGLGRRGPADYHTGRVALIAPASEPPGPAAVLPPLGTGVAASTRSWARSCPLRPTWSHARQAYGYCNVMDSLPILYCRWDTALVRLVRSLCAQAPCAGTQCGMRCARHRPRAQERNAACAARGAGYAILA